MDEKMCMQACEAWLDSLYMDRQTPHKQKEGR